MGKRFNRRFKKARRQKHFAGHRQKSSQLKKLLSHNYSRYLTHLSLGSRPIGHRIVLVGFSALSAALICGVVVICLLSLFTPRLSNIEDYLNSDSTIFYDRNGAVLFTVSGEENREAILEEEIPEHARLAAIAIEDDQFYDHRGIDAGGIFKAVLSEFGIGSPRGGSTITQQLVKNTFLSAERTYTRKVKEIMLSVRIERKYTKEQILTMYLNQIPYGGTAYGIEKASEVFFDKDASELTLAESAILAGLPKAPTYYSPFGSHKYTNLDKQFTVEELAARKNKVEDIGDLFETEYTYGLIGQEVDLPDGSHIYLPGRVDEVLKRMEKLGYITEEEKNAARVEVINLEFSQYKSNIKAPHFVFYVKEQLEREYGKELVENGGLKVWTTLDLDAQKKAEEIIVNQAAENARYNAANAALLSVDAGTGEVLAMVGSSDYFDEEIDGSVNMTTAQRQPGSSFKPLVYAAAFLNRFAPGTVIWDVPVKLGAQAPNNYDGKYNGPMSIRRALAQSRNIPAIKAYFLGGEQDGIIDMTARMGIDSLDRRRDYGWPLGLGTGEVKMTEMVQAYSVFANGGEKVDLFSVLRVEDADGKELVDNTEKPPSRAVEVLDEQVTYLISSILSDRQNNLGPLLNLPDRPAAAKTGTSNKKINASEIRPSNIWTIGYTPQFVTAVWAGNSDGSEMGPTASGYGGAAPAWQNMMKYLHEGLVVEEFKKPDGIKSVQVSKYSGMLPSKHTPQAMIASDLFSSFSVPTVVDDSFSVAVADTRNQKLPNEFCPAEFVKEVTFWNPRPVADKFNWQSEIFGWLANIEDETKEKLGLTETVVYGSLIDEVSELCRSDFADSAPTIVSVSPPGGSTVPKGILEVTAEVDAPNKIEKVEFYFRTSVNDTVTEAPYNGNVRVPPGLKTGEKFDVTVKAIDENGYSDEWVIELKAGKKASVEVEEEATSE